MNTQPSVPAFITHANLKCKKYIHLYDEIYESWELILQFLSSGLMKLDETIAYCWCPIVMKWRYGCNNGRYGCTIVMSYIEINKAVSQWLLTVNLCVSVTWPLTCAFHIPCTHTPEIIDMHRGMCDNRQKASDTALLSVIALTTFNCIVSASVTKGVLVCFVVTDVTEPIMTSQRLTARCVIF